MTTVTVDTDGETDAVDVTDSIERARGNADAHLRAMLVGASASLPVTDGSLDLGTWQSVLLVECDGPRTRTIDVRVHRPDR